MFTNEKKHVRGILLYDERKTRQGTGSQQANSSWAASGPSLRLGGSEDTVAQRVKLPLEMSDPTAECLALTLTSTSDLTSC